MRVKNCKVRLIIECEGEGEELELDIAGLGVGKRAEAAEEHRAQPGAAAVEEQVEALAEPAAPHPEPVEEDELERELAEAINVDEVKKEVESYVAAPEEKKTGDNIEVLKEKLRRIIGEA